VSAEVTVHGSGIPKFAALWTRTTAVAHTGTGGPGYQPDQHSTTIDIPPNDIPAKLSIFLKCPDAESAFAYAQEHFHEQVKGTHPVYAINRGEYSVTIWLRGEGLSRRYRFGLKNPGSLSDLVLTEY